MRRPALGYLAPLLLASCGGSSPVSPTPTPIPPTSPPTTPRIEELFTGQPVDASVSVAGNRVTVTAAGYLDRETTTAPMITLIPLRAPFDFARYRQLTRNTLEQPDPRSLWHWTQPIMLAYVPSDFQSLIDLAIFQRILSDAAAQLGAPAVIFQQVATLPDPIPGRLAVIRRVSTNALDGNCGRADVGRWIEFAVPGPARCSTQTLQPRTIAHEMGHLLGLYHVELFPGCLMCPTYQASASTQTTFSDLEQLAGRILHARPVGNMDPDRDN